MSYTKQTMKQRINVKRDTPMQEKAKLMNEMRKTCVEFVAKLEEIIEDYDYMSTRDFYKAHKETIDKLAK